MGKPEPVYTIGHSTRTVVEFVELLRIGNVELVVDIRSVPRSRINPQFNLDALPEALTSWQIGTRKSRNWEGCEASLRPYRLRSMDFGIMRVFMITLTMHCRVSFASACRACWN